MDSIDWTSIHGYDEWAHLLARVLQQALAAPDSAARTAARQALEQFRARVPGYGDDLSELARQAINALLLTDIAASLRDLAIVQQQLADLLHSALPLASLADEVSPATQRALKEASSWLLPLAEPADPEAAGRRRQQLAHLRLALQDFMASYTPPS